MSVTLTFEYFDSSYEKLCDDIEGWNRVPEWPEDEEKNRNFFAQALGQYAGTCVSQTLEDIRRLAFIRIHGIEMKIEDIITHIQSNPWCVAPPLLNLIARPYPEVLLNNPPIILKVQKPGDLKR